MLCPIHVFSPAVPAAESEFVAVDGMKTVYKTLTAGIGDAVVTKGNTVTVHAKGIVKESGSKFWSASAFPPPCFLGLWPASLLGRFLRCDRPADKMMKLWLPRRRRRGGSGEQEHQGPGAEAVHVQGRCGRGDQGYVWQLRCCLEPSLTLFFSSSFPPPKLYTTRSALCDMFYVLYVVAMLIGC